MVIRKVESLWTFYHHTVEPYFSSPSYLTAKVYVAYKYFINQEPGCIGGEYGPEVLMVQTEHKDSVIHTPFCMYHCFWSLSIETSGQYSFKKSKLNTTAWKPFKRVVMQDHLGQCLINAVNILDQLQRNLTGWF